MAQVAGITTKKNIRGEITHVTINVKKHKETIPMLTKLGVIPKTKFMQEWDAAKTIEQSKNEMNNLIDELWSK